MRNRSTWMVSGACILGALGFAGNAAASSHREAPAIAEDPAADNTDLYAFVNGSNLVVVANYIGLELPEGGPNWAKFSDDVLYQIHIALGGTSLADALTYQIQFTTKQPTHVTPGGTLPAPGAGGGTEFFSQLTGSGAFGQTYTVTQLTNGGTPTVVATNVPVPWPNVGPETNAVSYSPALAATAGAYEAHWVNGGTGPAIGALTGGGSVFAGPRDDPFWVDLGGIFDLAQLRPVANPLDAPRDSIAYMNVHAIVLSIPLTTVNGGTAPTASATGAAAAAQTAGVWASASRKKVTIQRTGSGLSDTHLGPWVQVSRIGQPLLNEAIIGVQDKDYWNHTTPADDLLDFAAYFLNPILVRDAQAVGFYAAGGPLENAGCDTALTHGDALTAGRADVVSTINLGNASIASVGDVLRVDLGAASGYPNGRLLTDKTTDIIFGLLLCGATNAGALVGAVGPTQNEVAFEATFPFLAPPWEGRSSNPRLAPSTLSQSGQPCMAAGNCQSGTCLAAGTCQ
jgi:hypothetical protein